MGRIKTQQVKRIGHELFTLHREDFKGDFTETKKGVAKYATFASKKLRNLVAGYITHLIRTVRE